MPAFGSFALLFALAFAAYNLLAGGMAFSTRPASRAGISTCLPTPAPIAMNTASKLPDDFSASTSSTLWLVTS